MAKYQDPYTNRAIKLIKSGSSLFITGKAGTGKTTLLRHIYDTFLHQKKIAIVAPTGVAAKQAVGVTIHSLLHLPLGPYLPTSKKNYHLYQLNDEDIEVIRQLDLLIIDEVSMVRCDVMDEMDDVLRHYRGRYKKNLRSLPFGGVQVIMFGDLHQLMPVAPEEEWEILRQHYKSPYFFSSDIYTRLKCPMLVLEHIYRQKDIDFINLLNNIRDGVLTSEDVQLLQQRYDKDFVPEDSEGYIRLTTHNWMAWKYNQRMLDNIDKPIYEYPAGVEGNLRWTELPTDKCLKLKVGARVMFIRNDNTWHEYVNGTLGTVVKLDDWYIEVQIDNGHVIEVPRVTWDFERYKYNKFRQELVIEHYGQFRQYPLKLAWCVTIHKSQGLTFDKVVIDAGSSFTYGQVYVALSRCRKLDGIKIVSQIKQRVLGADPVVEAFLKNTRKINVSEDKSIQEKPPQEKPKDDNLVKEPPQKKQKKENLQERLESTTTLKEREEKIHIEPELEKGARWTVHDEKKLIGLFKQYGLEEIENKFKERTRGEIIFKLKKLGLLRWNEKKGKYVRINK